MGNVLINLLLGLVLILVGAQLLERGAVGVATKLGLPRFVIGLTLVALSTSLPEIIIASGGVAAGFPGLALGTILGSNSLNILVVVAIAAMAHPLTVDKRALGWEGLIMLAAAGVLTGLMVGDEISQGAGLALLVGLLAYSSLVVFLEHRAAHPTSAASSVRRVPEIKEPNHSSLICILLVVVGMGAMFFGAKVLIEASAGLAYELGFEETVIGLFGLAFFTSLPELATVLTAAFRGHPGIALGTIIGSNVINTLGALGIAGLVKPIKIPDTITMLDLGVHAVASLLLFLFAFTGLRLSRVEGAVMLLIYVAYLVIRLGNGMT